MARMVKQTITFDDGTETVIDFTVDEQALTATEEKVAEDVRESDEQDADVSPETEESEDEVSE